jgi:hypothetical protein
MWFSLSNSDMGAEEVKQDVAVFTWLHSDTLGFRCACESNRKLPTDYLVRIRTVYGGDGINDDAQCDIFDVSSCIVSEDMVLRFIGQCGEGDFPADCGNWTG